MDTPRSRIRFCVAFGTILASHFERFFGHRGFRGFSVRIRFEDVFCADFAIEVQTPGVSINTRLSHGKYSKTQCSTQTNIQGFQNRFVLFFGGLGIRFPDLLLFWDQCSEELLFGSAGAPKLDHTGTFPGKFFGDILLRHCHVTNISQEQMRHIILFFIANVIKSWYRFLS